MVRSWSLCIRWICHGDNRSHRILAASPFTVGSAPDRSLAQPADKVLRRERANGPPLIAAVRPVRYFSEFPNDMVLIGLDFLCPGTWVFRNR